MLGYDASKQKWMNRLQSKGTINQVSFLSLIWDHAIILVLSSHFYLVFHFLLSCYPSIIAHYPKVTNVESAKKTRLTQFKISYLSHTLEKYLPESSHYGLQIILSQGGTLIGFCKLTGKKNCESYSEVLYFSVNNVSYVGKHLSYFFPSETPYAWQTLIKQFQQMSLTGIIKMYTFPFKVIMFIRTLKKLLIINHKNKLLPNLLIFCYKASHILVT